MAWQRFVWCSSSVVGTCRLNAVIAASEGAGFWKNLLAFGPQSIGMLPALGAQAANVLKLVLARSLKLISAGTVIGLIIAVMSTHTLRALLYSVSAFDAPTFVLVTILLAAVALVASYLPAMRASKADPMIALGHNT